MTGDGEGQATVEAAMALPIVVLALLMIVQVGVVSRDALALHHAAREGARAAAVTADDDAAREAIERAAGPLDATRIGVAIEPPSEDRWRGEPVSVSLSYPHELRIPVVGRLVPAQLTLRARTTMRLERSSTSPPDDPDPDDPDPDDPDPDDPDPDDPDPDDPDPDDPDPDDPDPDGPDPDDPGHPEEP